MKAFTNVLAAVMFAVFSLASCFFPPTARNSFAEGRYVYEGETVHFYEDLYIEELYMDLYLAEEYTPVEVGKTNLITNRKDKLTYIVDLEIKFAGRDFERFTVQSLHDLDHQTDRYRIVLDLSEHDLDINAKLNVVLDFYREKEIGLGSMYLFINNENIDGSLFSFPEKITLMQLDKED